MQPDVPATVRAHHLGLEHHGDECVGSKSCESRCRVGGTITERRSAEFLLPLLPPGSVVYFPKENDKRRFMEVPAVRKVRAVILAMSLCLFTLVGCSRDINYIVDHEPCVRGTVAETATEAIVIDVASEDELYEEHSSIRVSLDVERKDSMTEFDVGDEVAVYYDGSITGSDPAEINTVYAILLIGTGH